jgi:hypothetical protein
MADTHSSFFYDHESDVCYRTLTFLGYPGYRVGDDGTVWTRLQKVMLGGLIGGISVLGEQWHPRKLKVMKQRGKATYRLIDLMHKGKTRWFGVHRLVALAFIGQPSPRNHARHLDGNPANNTLGNLAWGTPKQNKADSRGHGTLAKGVTSGMSKLTDEAVLAMRARYATGLVTHGEIARDHGITRANAGKIVHGKLWTHVGGPIMPHRGRGRWPVSG